MFTLGLAAGCGGNVSGGGDDDVGDDDSGGEDAGGGLPPDAAPPRPVRFIAIGDTGEGNPEQYAVAAAMKTVCERAGGCDFAILLGDNIYDRGATTVDDPLFQTKFEQPYANLSFPFYAVLGNHDYGGNLLFDVPGLGNEFDQGPVEVMYTAISDKWEMPATHYSMKHGNVGFIMLDTNSILWSNTQHGDQRAWYPSALADIAGTDWTFVAGHHPYRSNGSHGNAGNYDAPELAGVTIPNPLPVIGGGELKSWFDDVVCGTADVYFSGHDHTRQWLDENEALCGAEMIVTGAGAKVTALRDRGNAVHYQDDQEVGFMLVEVVGKRMTGQFYGPDGVMDMERTITKP